MKKIKLIKYYEKYSYGYEYDDVLRYHVGDTSWMEVTDEEFDFLKNNVYRIAKDGERWTIVEDCDNQIPETIEQLKAMIENEKKKQLAQQEKYKKDNEEKKRKAKLKKFEKLKKELEI